MADAGSGHSICQVLPPTGGREMNRGCAVEGGNVGVGGWRREVGGDGCPGSGAAGPAAWGSWTSG